MPTLGVKVKVDHSELGGLESKLGTFGEKFEHHFLRHWGKLFGAGAAVGAIFKIGERVFGEPEEIEKTAKALGFTTDEIQYLSKAAKDAGITLEEYLSRAEKKAVDLGAVIKKMREKGDFKIISEEDIKTINAVADADKKAIDDVTKAATHGVGAFIRFWQEARREQQMEIIRVRQARGIPLGPELEEIYKNRFTPGVAGPDVGLPSRASLLAAPDTSQGMRDYEAKVFLRKQIKKLQNQALALRVAEGEPMETIRPELTGRQQAGAYAGGRVSVISTLTETNRRLQDIQTQIQDFEDKLTGIP